MSAGTGSAGGGGTCSADGSKVRRGRTQRPSSPVVWSSVTTSSAVRLFRNFELLMALSDSSRSSRGRAASATNDARLCSTNFLAARTSPACSEEGGFTYTPALVFARIKLRLPGALSSCTAIGTVAGGRGALRTSSGTGSAGGAAHAKGSGQSASLAESTSRPHLSPCPLL